MQQVHQILDFWILVIRLAAITPDIEYKTKAFVNSVLDISY